MFDMNISVRTSGLKHRDSIGSASSASSILSAVNSVVYRQSTSPSLEEERRCFSLGLDLLEPRPTTHFVGFAERIASADALDSASAASSPTMSPALSSSALFRA